MSFFNKPTTRPMPGKPTLDLEGPNTFGFTQPPIKNDPGHFQKVMNALKGIAKRTPIEIILPSSPEPKPTGETITLDSIGSLYQDHLLLVHKKADTGERRITIAKGRNAPSKPMPGLPIKKQPKKLPIGWFEEYTCGCISPTVKMKKDLVGYCGTHGNSSRGAFPEFPK